ncbi:transposase [Haloterrigena sp. H1]|uniref:RNA-guided endonuclease InsQ/TnpB family protein n=1 Tax=Haloterrigena sp. H1 TaxID=2552943 RepID=UPI00110E6AE0|nr:RNA-guided endonuclease TnpB family protein [Haloterrigena sp. H1]TMT87131.1 transposase [Haloterrigena sp. H1]
MNYNYRYRLNPFDDLRKRLAWTVDTCRQVYNHFLHRLNRHDDTSAYSEQKRLPDLKKWWSDLRDVHSKVLQKVVQRLYDNLSTLNARKENGYNVGKLKWKAPGEYQSFTYSQSGFKLKNTSGRTQLWLSKIGDIPLTFHRDLPDDAIIKTVTVKREPTGKWYAILGVETLDDPPEKPDEVTDAVGIDVGILKYVHDSDDLAVESPDLSDERERLERAQRNLSRKEHGSNNWEEQRKTVARRHADLKRKRRDFLHKLSAYYAREYNLVAVEDLDAKGLVELPGNSRNRAGASWGTFLRILEYKCKREGTYFVAVDPRGTTKECASCGFEADRDANASWNILSRGLDKVGTGCPESPPVETALLREPLRFLQSAFVEGTSTGCQTKSDNVVETGSPTLKERTASAVSE